MCSANAAPGACAGLSAVIGEAVQVDTRHAQPQRNPAVTGQLATTAHRYPSERMDAPMATHYYAKTTYRANYFYWLLYALSIIASLFYFFVRIYYIARGLVRTHSHCHCSTRSSPILSPCRPFLADVDGCTMRRR
jgi:hypothetical protein